MPLTLLSASKFSIEELTAAYNQTRVDYMVPMPLNAARLQEYIDIYDVDMDRSVVAVAEEQMLGINMIGVRDDRSWITRLGVLPVKRRQGAGEAMSRHLLTMSADLSHGRMILEVIKDNLPAHTLFKKLAFYETRQLLVLRHPPNGALDIPPCTITWLEKDAALALLDTYPGPLAWTNQPETFQHVDDTRGLIVELPDGSRGWMIFRKQTFYLSHFVLHTEQGDPAEVGHVLLVNVHRHFPMLDTHTENIATDDPHLPAFWKLGYLEAFRRIEMYRDA
jgi:ribosomal protein S18 acetylase RimI-like enzyme